ncbi:Dual specificity protein phosphatase 23 [Linnemannia zychae]|nr:Dual specificity protein phosphatase 23 [Linnemannia zychae]
MSDSQDSSSISMDLTLARAAAAFKDADFFEASVLFWSALLDSSLLETETADSLIALANSLDLEQELGLDVQTEEPIDLVFPPIANESNQCQYIDEDNVTPLQTYVLTALCYLSRHINIRLDILPSGQDTLTSLGPPQRFYGSLATEQKLLYHQCLAIIFATLSSLLITRRAAVGQDVQEKELFDQELLVQQSTLLGNQVSTTWQTILPQKRTPHSMPRFFSFLNPSSSTIAGCSIPRNELDIDALEQAGIRLVITLIKESPLSPSWFHKEDRTPKRIQNAFVPIENRKAPTFPEIFEVLMGWCLRAGDVLSTATQETDKYDRDSNDAEDEDHSDTSLSGLASPPHCRATMIHCGGGKGRAGIVLAAHLIRFGLLGHETRGYCRECIREKNVHHYDLDQFKKGFGDQITAASTLPTPCHSIVDNQEDDDDNEDGCSEKPQFERVDGGVFRVVKRTECLNRYQPMMTAKDAIAHLREIRPGSIESVEQEKALKFYGDWLWKRSSSKSTRSKTCSTTQATTLDHSISDTLATATSEPTLSTAGSDRHKSKKDKKKDTIPKPQHHLPPSVADEADDFSDDDYNGKGRKSGKKGKKNSRKLPQEEPRIFVPPPPDKIIKISGSQHHQHHLIVQHNMRARQLQRGQKSKKNSGGNGKHSKERPSYQVSGSPLVSAPKLIILAGLPGSGKSHLVTTLLQEFPEHFVRISQDELGSRAVCERLLAQSMRHQQQSLAVRGPKKALPMTIFVDRCNPTMAERKEWYEVAFQPDDVAMVWFSQGVEACIARVDSRESHPTVAQGMGSKVVRSFAKSFEFPNLGKEGSWCKTLIEVGDDEGSDRLLDVLRAFAKEIQGSSARTTPGGEHAPIKARPAFIPARVLQRKSNGGKSAVSEFSSCPSSPVSKLPTSGGMEIVEEGEEEEDEEDERENSHDDDHDEETDDNTASEDESSSGVHPKAEDSHSTQPDSNTEQGSTLASAVSITKALQFASLTGYRPVVKKPVKGSWKDNANSSSTSNNTDKPSMADLGSPKGVSFATPLSTYDRPLQKFPRTPHLFDPLTIMQSRAQGSDHLQTTLSQDMDPAATAVGRSTAISRSDLLLPPSALQQVFAPKPHQVLTVEEKMDGANIGFSVLHFKTMNGFAGISGSGPPPKIRVQNRNHFVHPDDHWQFKKLGGWLEKHREDILYLCEGRWRYDSKPESSDNESNEDDTKCSPRTHEEENEAKSIGTEDEDDQDWEDEDEDQDEYVDENKVLQDGMAPYVLYGEWLYAKHSVHYTGLQSWFIPFDLFDVKTGTFVSRAVFRKAIGNTQLTVNPAIKIPEDVYGDPDKTLAWTLQTLHSRSSLMCEAGEESAPEQGEKDRVEGLYFRIDQGDRLLMRSKVVRPDFIAGEERWGTKEQVANQMRYPLYSEYDEQ